MIGHWAKNDWILAYAKPPAMPLSTGNVERKSWHKIRDIRAIIFLHINSPNEVIHQGATIMPCKRIIYSVFPMVLVMTNPLHALPLGHHGSLVTQCTDPRFFAESPEPDTKVSSLDHFLFTASDNTDSASIKVKVNLQPVDIKVTQKRSGEWAVEATLPTPIKEGRAWIKVTGMSHDGCDQIHTWNVYAGH
jgi:hypothetical protein